MKNYILDRIWLKYYLTFVLMKILGFQPYQYRWYKSAAHTRKYDLMRQNLTIQYSELFAIFDHLDFQEYLHIRSMEKQATDALYQQMFGNTETNQI